MSSAGNGRPSSGSGNFLNENTGDDGFPGTAPVASFAANGYGLSDMVGNVWEWTHDFYRLDYYAQSPEKNPDGPETSFDPREPGLAKNVTRGVSFMRIMGGQK